MIDEPDPPAALAAWIVCERHTRWLTASRRFVPEALPEPARVRIIAAEARRALAMMAGAGRAAVLWEIDPDRFEHACQWVAKTSISAPQVLQVAAIARLAPRDQLILSELGVAICLRDPEQLPGLAPLIQGAFAHSVESLD